MSIHKIITGNFSYPKTNYFNTSHFFKPLNYSFNSVLASIWTILLFSLLSLIYARLTFEKTQSNELLYWTLFIFGCLWEGIRLLFPLLDLWNENTLLTTFISKAVIFGRSVSIGAILFSSLFSENEYRQYREQNLIVIILVSISFAKVMPVNSMIATPLCHLEWSFGNLLRIVQLVIFFVGVTALIFKEYIEEGKIKIPFMTIIFYIGYLLICDAYCWLSYGIGTVMCFLGTFFYLKNLHKSYMWN